MKSEIYSAIAHFLKETERFVDYDPVNGISYSITLTEQELKALRELFQKINWVIKGEVNIE